MWPYIVALTAPIVLCCAKITALPEIADSPCLYFSPCASIKKPMHKETLLKRPDKEIGRFELR